MTKKHFHSDGNGGFYVSKSAISAISVIMLLLGALIPTVFAWSTMRNELDTLKAREPAVEAQVNINTKELAIINTKLSSIDTSLKEIKSDVRDINGKIDRYTIP